MRVVGLKKPYSINFKKHKVVLKYFGQSDPKTTVFDLPLTTFHFFKERDAISDWNDFWIQRLSFPNLAILSTQALWTSSESPFHPFVHEVLVLYIKTMEAS